MELSINPNNINAQNIFFSEKKKNIIMDGHFIKIIYSTNAFEMNGLYMLVEFETIKDKLTKNVLQTNCKNSSTQKCNIILNKCSIENKNLVDILCKIETDIIERYISNNCLSKSASYVLKNQFINGIIKYQTEEYCIEHKSLKKSLLFGNSINNQIIKTDIFNNNNICKQYFSQIAEFNPEMNEWMYYNDFSNLSLCDSVENQKIYTETNLINSTQFEFRKQNDNKKFDKEKFILKISGVWETATNVGITMKFILVR